MRDPVSVRLLPVGEAELGGLVAAALADASAAEVTPPVTPGEEWTPGRVDWLRTFHRQARAGLGGPARTATWAVVDAADTGRVLGSVRLRRTDEPDVLETGIWLVREARGRGVGREAVRQVVERAREAGAVSLRAETTAGNAGALAVLRFLGFRITVDGERVAADLALSG